MVAANNTELDEMEEEILNQKKIVENMELFVEELKEEIATRDDALEQYENKYGPMKKGRSRDLENHISDCLRWVSQEECGVSRI